MSASIRNSEGQLALSGPLTAENVTRLMDAAPAFNGGTVEVNISGTSEIDSAGLALLVYWEGLITGTGGTMRISGVSPRAASLMRISGLAHLAEAAAPGTTDIDTETVPATG